MRATARLNRKETTKAWNCFPNMVLKSVERLGTGAMSFEEGYYDAKPLR